MAKYLTGPRWSVQQVPGSAVSAGDVVVQGNLTLVSDLDNPLTGASGPIIQGALYMGGLYQMAADAAYANGTMVYWDTAKQQVTTTFKSGVTFPFGWIVCGPNNLLSDGGPTGAAGVCSVLHNPIFASGLLQAGQPYANFRNIIDGGDFTVNPFQRGTSQAADITSTTTYGPDRFAFKGAAGSAINWSQVADTTVAGFGNSLKWQRKAANADVNPLNMVQVVETADSIRMQGRTVTVSFYARAGANYSGGVLTVQLETSTGSNQSAANLIAGSWTGQAHVVNATQALTTTMTRYQFTGTVPNSCTQLGLLFQWTPAGTAGADDSIVINGIQVEDGLGATPFEHRDIEVELALCQRYYFRITEQNGINVAIGQPGVGANLQVYSIPMPTPMRVAPTVTVTAGGFKVVIDGAAAAAVTTFAAGSVHSPTFINLQTANTLTAAAHSVVLQGSATTGLIEASADF